jgi:hypothetical protein
VDFNPLRNNKCEKPGSFKKSEMCLPPVEPGDQEVRDVRMKLLIQKKVSRNRPWRKDTF